MRKRHLRLIAVPVVGLSVLIGCVSAAPGSDRSASVPSQASVTSPSATPADTAGSSMAAATPPHVPSTCHVTKPMHLFVPPAGSAAPARLPAYYDAEWYGTARLWTILRHNGEVWYGLPHGPDGLVQKTFWWSADFDVNHERQPAISVTGRQLDGPGRFASPAPGTNAQADFGSAMLMGVDVPTTGCWQITATYRHASLSFVAWVSR